MRYIETLYDHAINKNYQLYQINAKELAKRLRDNYQLSNEFLQLFNSDSQLASSLIRLKSSQMDGREDSHAEKLVEDAKEKIKKGEYISPMTKKGIHLGYELMPIVISANGDIQNPNTSLELIDGFKRMLAMEVHNIPEIPVLVKVYESLNDTEWINSMILYNSWKFTGGEGSKTYMDRGFQLGLYHRYQISVTSMIMKREDFFSAIDIYTTDKAFTSYWNKGGSNEGTYQTFWNNSCFHDDIQAIYDIYTTESTFSIKKKGIMEEYVTKHQRHSDGGYGRILELFVTLLGQVRRYEYNHQIENRKPFDRTIVTEFFSDSNWQKHFVKIVNMSVDGHIVNYINAHLREEMKKRMYEGMGYEYHPPKPKEKMTPVSYEITEDML